MEGYLGNFSNMPTLIWGNKQDNFVYCAKPNENQIFFCQSSMLGLFIKLLKLFKKIIFLLFHDRIIMPCTFYFILISTWIVNN